MEAWAECLRKKCVALGKHAAVSPLQAPFPDFKHTRPFRKSCSVSLCAVHFRSSERCAERRPGGRRPPPDRTVTPVHSLAPPRQVTVKGGCWEAFQDVKAATAAQLELLTEKASRAASESGQRGWVCLKWRRASQGGSWPCGSYCHDFLKFKSHFSIRLPIF